MKFQITIFLIVSLFFACESKNELVTEELSENSKIINEDSITLAIISVTLEEFKFHFSPPPPPPPPPLDRNEFNSDEEFEEEILKNKLIYEEIKVNTYDTVKFVYYINEHLFPLEYNSAIEYLDESFVVDSLDFPFSNEIKIINIDSIKQVNFKLISERYSNPIASQFYHIENYNGIMNFSKMLFNQDYTKVIFSFDYIFSCGMTYQLKTIKMEYIDKQWQLIEQKTFNLI
jgi:hypothetical protein